MKITRWEELGILCSGHIASHEVGNPSGSCSAQEISDSLNIPFQYTQQILYRLKKGKVITALRGPKGGYRLSKTAAEITLRDILYAMEGATFEIICESGPIYEKSCQQTNNHCGLQGVWKDLQKTIDSFLSERSLAWLIEQNGITPLKDQLVQLESHSANRTTLFR